MRCLLPELILYHCPRCAASKPREEFYSNKSKPSGVDSFCRECRKSASREAVQRYEATPEGKAKKAARAKARVYSPEQKAAQKLSIQKWEKEHRKERTAAQRKATALPFPPAE